MDNQIPITVTEQDYERLSLLLLHIHDESSDQLEDELSRAQVLPQTEIPNDTVTMNSTITFVDEETKKESKLTLVYLKDADVEQMKVSILAPVGTALLGLSIGQSIGWPLPNGKVRRLKVLSIIYQPEASQDWQL